VGVDNWAPTGDSTGVTVAHATAAQFAALAALVVTAKLVPSPLHEYARFASDGADANAKMSPEPPPGGAPASVQPLNPRESEHREALS
jgi:hypothetical protein